MKGVNSLWLKLTMIFLIKAWLNSGFRKKRVIITPMQGKNI